MFLRWEIITLHGLKIDPEALDLLAVPGIVFSSSTVIAQFQVVMTSNPDNCHNFLTGLQPFILTPAHCSHNCDLNFYLSQFSSCLCPAFRIFGSSLLPTWREDSVRPVVVETGMAFGPVASCSSPTVTMQFLLVICWIRSPKPEILNRNSYQLTHVQTFLWKEKKEYLLIFISITFLFSIVLMCFNIIGMVLWLSLLCLH